MTLTGADILVRCLQDEGIEYIFGYPGGAALHIYDAMYRQDKVKHILYVMNRAQPMLRTGMPGQLAKQV